MTSWMDVAGICLLIAGGLWLLALVLWFALDLPGAIFLYWRYYKHGKGDRGGRKLKR